MLIIRLQKNEESGQGNTGKVTARGAAGSGPEIPASPDE